MPFAAITAMKAQIGARFPYKDVRGTWHVSIVFKADSILVRHHKVEQAAALHSGDELPIDYFQFDWVLGLECDPSFPPRAPLISLIFRFMLDCRGFNPTIQITDYDSHTKMPPEMLRDLQQVLSPFLDPKLPYARMLRRDLSQVGLHRDLGRHVPKLVVADASGRKVHFRPSLFSFSFHVRGGRRLLRTTWIPRSYPSSPSCLKLSRVHKPRLMSVVSSTPMEPN